MGCMLLQLPEVLVQHVLSEWLPFKTVVKLDSAMCNNICRPVFQSIAFASVAIYAVPRNLVVSKNAQWFVAKGARLTGVSVSRSLFADSDLLSQFLGMQTGLHWLKLTGLCGQDCVLLLQEFSMYCRNLSKLQEVNVSNSDISPCCDAITALVRSCKQLRTLRLHNSIRGDKGIEDILLSCDHLTTLRLYLLKYEVPTCVARPTLTYLDLHGCHISEDVMVAIGAHCPKLETLHCYEQLPMRPVGFTDTGMRAVLKGCPQLRKADVECASNLSAETRVELAGRGNCTRLRLDKWLYLPSALVARLLRVCPNLVALTVSHRPITDIVLIVCALHCPMLRSLELIECPAITTAGAALLFQRCTSLRTVHLIYTVLVWAGKGFLHCAALSATTGVHTAWTAGDGRGSEEPGDGLPRAERSADWQRPSD